MICVGSELLRGKINTHSSTLARRLASAGLSFEEERTVGDELKTMTLAIRQALDEYELVIVTGGLGPTFDDVTREAVAAACGRTLVFSPPLLADIKRKFKKARYKKMPPTNARQAYLVEGASAIPNSVGTAPGQWLDLGQKIVVMLPGPPSELHPMVDRVLLPKLKALVKAPPSVEAHLHFVGVPESIVDDRIRPIIDREPGVQFTILAHLGLVDFDIFVTGTSIQAARKRLTRIVKKIRSKMGKAFYGVDENSSLERVILKSFRAKKETLAVAESCTGGMLAQRLTDIAGSSAYFQGGVISYSDGVKRTVLNVSTEILSTFGAVSKQAAIAMAHGVQKVCNSTWGLSITGIAGPDGGTARKPVGLVFIGLSGPRATRVFEYRFHGSRDAIRQRSVIAALDLLRLIYL